MTFSYFSNIAYQVSFDGRNEYSKFIHPIKKFIGEDNINVFYPKNLLIDDEKLSIYIFQDQLSIADGFYQLCSSFYHSLRSNVPLLAEWFTIIKKGMNRGSQLPSCLSTYKD